MTLIFFYWVGVESLRTKHGRTNVNNRSCANGSRETEGFRKDKLVEYKKKIGYRFIC